MTIAEAKRGKRRSLPARPGAQKPSARKSPAASVRMTSWCIAGRNVGPEGPTPKARWRGKLATTGETHPHKPRVGHRLGEEKSRSLEGLGMTIAADPVGWEKRIGIRSCRRIGLSETFSPGAGSSWCRKTCVQVTDLQDLCYEAHTSSGRMLASNGLQGAVQGLRCWHRDWASVLGNRGVEG
jgi:hypothetical protein